LPVLLTLSKNSGIIGLVKLARQELVAGGGGMCAGKTS